CHSMKRRTEGAWHAARRVRRIRLQPDGSTDVDPPTERMLFRPKEFLRRQSERRQLLGLVQLVLRRRADDTFYPAGAVGLTVTACSACIHHVPAGNTTLRMPSHQRLSAAR